jgi:hypothetical protein
MQVSDEDDDCRGRLSPVRNFVLTSHEYHMNLKVFSKKTAKMEAFLFVALLLRDVN